MKVQNLRWRAASVVLLTFILASPLSACEQFIRADANTDQRVDISDAVFILKYLFQGEVIPVCPEALDADASTKTDISDPIYVLNYLFLGGPQPPPPFVNNTPCTPPPGYFPVKTEQDLSNIRNAINMNYFICNDIVLTADFEPIESIGGMGFQARLDGNNKKIIGLTINKPNQNSVGLFAKIDEIGYIYNLNLVNPHVTGKEKVGALAGQNFGRIKNCSIINAARQDDNTENTFSVAGVREVGGLVGRNEIYQSGIITDSSVVGAGKISGLSNPSYAYTSAVGGLVGQNFKGNINNSFVSEKVLIENDITLERPSEATGGLVGNNLSGIFLSHSKAKVKGTRGVGGLAGISLGHISSSSAAGRVEGNSAVGGLIGELGFTGGGSIVRESFASGNVIGETEVGGLVGATINDTGIIDCYALGSVTGAASVGGLVGAESAFLFRQAGMIYDSYAYGKVSIQEVAGINHIGGLIGDRYIPEKRFNNSYFNQTLNPNLPDDDPARNEGKTELELKTLETFVDNDGITTDDWDISYTDDSKNTVWKIQRGQIEPPKLRWQLQ